jgi:hypothetical protein
VPTFVTPIERTWTSPVSGETYFMKFRIEIPSFDADLVVESLMDSQEFPVVGSPVYEGVASAEGTFRGRRVRGRRGTSRICDDAQAPAAFARPPSSVANACAMRIGACGRAYMRSM